MHAWSNDNSTWQQEPVLSDDLTDDCVETQPTATGQVCDERVTRYQVVDVARSEAGGVRWIATVERESGIYTAACQPRLDDPYGGLACVWNPSASVTRTLSLILGSLRGDTIQFTPVPGLSWAMDPGSGPLFARGASAIDSMGWIHIAYHLAQPSPVEIHHLVLSPG
jgi:hypothetical protein